MPVGCLGNAARGPKEEPFHKNEPEGQRNGHEQPVFETILTSSRLNSSDQFAFMQHTLLLQIFRIHDDEDRTRSSPSSDDSNGRVSILCPTCVGFSDQCCQQDHGFEIFHNFIDANLNCHWDPKLLEAISSLRYQGYVCPGILVLIANASQLDVMCDAWKRRLVTSPPGCRISQVGVSNGCLVKPIVQTHTISLPDFLCLLLARLKQSEQTVDMETLCKSVEQDWNGVAPFCRTNGMDNLRETIHACLGGLIKQRKIYYTGNKGYFLVANDNNSNRSSDLKSWRRSLPKRLSFRSKSSNNGHAQNSADKDCQTDGLTSPQSSPNGKLDTTPSKEAMSSPKGSADEVSPSSVVAESSFNLERSQSLRISRNSLRNISKGGSLRFSKREAAKLLAEQEEKNLALELGGDITPPKQFERKNSFLGKIFGGSSKNKKGPNSTTKPILGTFSAQFPPSEDTEVDHHATYQALKRAAQSIYNSPPPNPPNGNGESRKLSIEEDLYDRPATNGHDMGSHTAISVTNNIPIYSKVSPFRKKDGSNNFVTISDNHQQQNIYGVGSPLSLYGYSTVGNPGHGLSVSGNPECVYSYPPPPLPYRPSNWSNGPNSLQSSSSSTSSPTQRHINSPTLRQVNSPTHINSPTNLHRQQINSPTNRSQNSASPCRATNSPSSNNIPLTPQQKLQQQLLNNQQQLQLQQQHNQLQYQHLQQQQQQNNNNVSPWSTPGKRNGNQSASNLVNNNTMNSNNNSTTVTSSSSNDSLALESKTTKPLFNDDLLVIERSNRELELRLSVSKQQQQQLYQQQQHQEQLYQQEQQEQLYEQHKQLYNQQQEQKYQLHLQQQEQLYQQQQKYQQQQEHLYQHQLHEKHYQQQEQLLLQKQPLKDTPNKNENSPSAKPVKNRAIRFTLPASQKNRNAIVIDTIHNNNGSGFADVIYEETSQTDEVERIKTKISRPLSECFSASQDNLDVRAPQSFPSIGDLHSLEELSGSATFKSLTAQKLMSGISFNSIDTLLEVNAAAEARSKHNESTETIDFGVI